MAKTKTKLRKPLSRTEVERQTIESAKDRGWGWATKTETGTPAGPTFEEGLIVGLLMARGSFTGDQHAGRLAMLSGDLEMLQWIKSRIGGTIAGPYNQKGRAPHHVYQLSGQPLLPVLELLSAWMPTGAQRTKYLAWLKKYSNIVRPESSKPAKLSANRA